MRYTEKYMENDNLPRSYGMHPCSRCWQLAELLMASTIIKASIACQLYFNLIFLFKGLVFVQRGDLSTHKTELFLVLDDPEKAVLIA